MDGGPRVYRVPAGASLPMSLLLPSLSLADFSAARIGGAVSSAASRFFRDSRARWRIFHRRHGIFSCHGRAGKIFLDPAGIQIDALPDLDASGRSLAGNPIEVDSGAAGSVLICTPSGEASWYAVPLIQTVCSASLRVTTPVQMDCARSTCDGRCFGKSLPESRTLRCAGVKKSLPSGSAANPTTGMNRAGDEGSDSKHFAHDLSPLGSMVSQDKFAFGCQVGLPRYWRRLVFLHDPGSSCSAQTGRAAARKVNGTIASGRLRAEGRRRASSVSA